MPTAKVKVKVKTKPEAKVEEVEEVAEPKDLTKLKAVVSPRGATIGREDFVYLLQVVRPGLSPRGIVEQSSCVAFKDGNVITFNEEVMCTAPSGLPKEWEAAVNHKPLFDQLQKWPDENLTVNLANGFLVTNATGSRKLELNMERQVLMPLDKVEKPGNKWIPLHDDFTDAVGIVESCAGKDASRPALTCIHIMPEWIEACDNFQLTRYRFKTGMEETCVKRDSLKIIPELEMRDYNETEQWIHFKARSGLIVSIRKHKEEFLDLANFLEVEGVKTTLPKSLGEAVERAKLLSDETADNPQIKVHLTRKGVTLRADGASGYFVEGKKVEYKGEEIRFTVSPNLLLELIKRHTDCIVSPNYRIKVDGPKWRYVACLEPTTEDK